MKGFDPVQAAIPFFVLAIVLELALARLGRGRAPYEVRDTAPSLLWLPLSLLGFPPAMVAIQKGISLVYQFWIHTEAIGRMPAWFEAVFNTPSHHRVHHARNPRYLDANYAGILIVWDRMFGTFIP